MLRAETRRRARALQLLYAWEQLGRPSIGEVVHRLLTGAPQWRRSVEEAEPLALDVAEHVADLDAAIAEAVEHWRPERVGLIEQNILRLALRELERGATPAKVVISEAVRLAHWFAGDRAPGFVNGVLDALARRVGRL